MGIDNFCALHDEENLFDTVEQLERKDQELKSQITLHLYGVPLADLRLDKYQSMAAKLAKGLASIQPDLKLPSHGDQLMDALAHLFTIWIYALTELNNGNLTLMGVLDDYRRTANQSLGDSG